MLFLGLDDIESTCWANIEGNIAILCACLPIFRRPLALLFPRLLSALGDHPEPVSQREDRRFSPVGMDKNQWAGDGSKLGSAPHDFTSPMDADATGTRNCGSDKFVMEYVEDAKIELR
jgi:hypothetical protein